MCADRSWLTINEGSLKPETKTIYGNCQVCEEDFEWDENDSLHFARIQRGWFMRDDDGGIEENNIKAEFWIYRKCYLENPFLCQFFNSIGLRIR
jgi:hypothetical protein